MKSGLQEIALNFWMQSHDEYGNDVGMRAALHHLKLNIILSESRFEGDK